MPVVLHRLSIIGFVRERTSQVLHRYEVSSQDPVGAQGLLKQVDRSTWEMFQRSVTDVRDNVHSDTTSTSPFRRLAQHCRPTAAHYHLHLCPRPPATSQISAWHAQITDTSVMDCEVDSVEQLGRMASTHRLLSPIVPWRKQMTAVVPSKTAAAPSSTCPLRY